MAGRTRKTDTSVHAALAPLLMPGDEAAALIAWPGLAQTWAQMLVMHWSRAERLGGLDLSQPLYVLDLAPGDGRLAGWLLPALEQQMQGHGMAGWPVRYVLCPLPGAPFDVGVLTHAPLASFAERGRLHRASWQARTGHPLLLGDARFPLFGVRNPLAAISAGGLSLLPAHCWGLRRGQLLRGHARLQPAADAAQAIEWEWEPAATADGAARLPIEHYRAALPGAPVLLSDASLALVDALSDFSAGRYLLLAADTGVAQEAAIRAGAFALPPRARAGELQLPVNFHALRLHQESAGARAANLEAVDSACIVHLAWRDDQVPSCDESWQALVEHARQAHPVQRWWALDDADAGDARAWAVQLQACAQDPWRLPALLHDEGLQHAQSLARCAPATLGTLRESLARAWQGVPHAERNGELRAWIAALSLQLGHYPLARELLEGSGSEAATLELLRARLAIATGALPSAMEHLHRHLAAHPGDAKAQALQAQLQRRWQARGATRWARACAGAEQGGLRLEPLDEFHIPPWLHHLRDAQLAATAGVVPVATADDCIAELARIDGETTAEFALVDHDHGFVGGLGLHCIADAVHLWFWIGGEHQGRRFGSRALALLCGVLREQRIAHAFASVHRGNLRSHRLLVRAGFAPLDCATRGADAQYHFMHLALQDTPARDAATLLPRLRELCAAIGEPLDSELPQESQ